MTATTSAAYGLKPVKHPSGQVRPYELTDGILSGYTSAILQYQPVKLASTGVLQAAAATDTIIGSFAGCFYTASVNSRPIFSNQWVASTTYVAGSLIAYFWQNPEIIYNIQADGSCAQSMIGEEVDFTSVTAGNTTTGFSAATCSATAALGDGVLRIIDLVLTPDNAWGDTYTQLQVQIAKHQRVAPFAGF